MNQTAEILNKLLIQSKITPLTDEIHIKATMETNEDMEQSTLEFIQLNNESEYLASLVKLKV